MTSNKGFTLIEMIVSVFIITVGLVGVFSSITKYSQMTQEEKENFQAYYIAQEGIEIVKNMRDSNWVDIELNGTEGATWKDNLTSCASGCEADYDDTALTAWSSPGRFLYIDGGTGGNEMYKYIETPGTGDVKTLYKRKITISEVDTYELDIIVDIYWADKSIQLKENIYNWK